MSFKGKNFNKIEGLTIQQENELLKSILDNINEGIFVSDNEGKVIFYNKTMEEIEEINRNNVIGKKILELYPVSKKYSSTYTVMKSGEPVIEKEHSYIVAKNNKIVNVIYSTYPFYMDGKLKATYCIIRDVTKMKDFLTKSIEYYRKLSDKSEKNNNNNGTIYTFEDIITVSPKMKDTIKTAREIASHNTNVMIYGETGTGKEMIAQGIHNFSLNSDGPFIAVNCAALPDNLIESLLFGTVKGAFTGAEDSEGLFEQAENGTLFLDEINSMDINLQSKLLRVLQDKLVRRIGGKENIKINCRIITALNRNPLDEIKRNCLRNDLFYRLSTTYIQIPPLRERPEDITILLKHFLRKYNSIYNRKVESISDDLLNTLQNYEWPGNVRELDNFVENSLINVGPQTKQLTINNISDFFKMKFRNQKSNVYLESLGKEQKTLKEIIDEVEKQTIEYHLKKNNGNVSKTARELGIARQNLHYKIKKLSITPSSL